MAIVSASAVAGALLATLAMAAELPRQRYAGHAHADDAVAIETPICSTATSATTFYSEMAQANTRMHAGMEIAPSGDPDRDFARMMIPHHQGAIDMALVELKYGRDEKLKRLAQSIIVEQGQEIAYLRALLASQVQATSPAASGTDPAASKQG